MEKRKTDLVVTGCIFDDMNRVLLILHGKLNLWLPVGGHIEENETPDEALRREIFEETGLDVNILNENRVLPVGNVKEILAIPFHVNVHSVGDHDHCSFFYVCKALNAEELKINNELKNSRWFSKEELDEEMVPTDVRDIAKEAFKIFEQTKF